MVFMIGRLTDEEIEAVLKENVFGHIGCNDGFNTYVFPINYVYDGVSVICHSQAGAKIDVMRQNKRVCFQVDEVNNFMNWKSVMVLGEYREAEDERERYNALKTFVEHLLYMKISKPDLVPGAEQHIHKPSTARPVIYRILIEERSGRFEKD